MRARCWRLIASRKMVCDRGPGSVLSLPSRMAECERGSGSVLSIAVIGALAALIAIALPLYLGLSVKQSLQGTADAAALAAADVVVGLIPGYPCRQAERVAAANGASIRSCELDGLVASVTVTRPIAGIPAAARATAGPPVDSTK